MLSIIFMLYNYDGINFEYFRIHAAIEKKKSSLQLQSNIVFWIILLYTSIVYQLGDSFFCKFFTLRWQDKREEEGDWRVESFGGQDNVVVVGVLNSRVGDYVMENLVGI